MAARAPRPAMRKGTARRDARGGVVAARGPAVRRALPVEPA